MLFDSYVISGVSIYAAPNSCKKLTKRRMFARAASAALGQSTLDGGTPLARPFYNTARPACRGLSSPCEAALQFMRYSLGAPNHVSPAVAACASSRLSLLPIASCQFSCGTSQGFDNVAFF